MKAVLGQMVGLPVMRRGKGRDWTHLGAAGKLVDPRHLLPTPPQVFSDIGAIQSLKRLVSYSTNGTTSALAKRALRLLGEEVPRPILPSVPSWKEAEVQTWLQQIGFSQYCERFRVEPWGAASLRPKLAHSRGGHTLIRGALHSDDHVPTWPACHGAWVSFGVGKSVLRHFWGYLALIWARPPTLTQSPVPSPCILCMGSRSKEGSLPPSLPLIAPPGAAGGW